MSTITQINEMLENRGVLDITFGRHEDGRKAIIAKQIVREDASTNPPTLVTHQKVGDNFAVLINQVSDATETVIKFL